MPTSTMAHLNIYRAISAPENNRANHLGAVRASKTNTNRRHLPLGK